MPPLIMGRYPTYVKGEVTVVLLRREGIKERKKERETGSLSSREVHLGGGWGVEGVGAWVPLVVPLRVVLFLHDMLYYEVAEFFNIFCKFGAEFFYLTW